MKLLIATLLALSPLLAHAECMEMEPLCHSMHEMSSALDCITGEMPAMLCTDDQIATLESNSKDARAALLAKQTANAPADVLQQINSLFDQLDQAIQELKAAGEDPTAKAAALDKINAIRKQGHMDFKK